jgi:protein SCO1
VIGDKMIPVNREPLQTSAPSRGPERMGRVWRRWLWPVVVVAAAGALAGGAAAWWHAHRSPALAGAVLTPPAAAPDFRLSDQDGRVVSLANLRGKVIALTFLYTRCPDVCPLIADQMRAAYQRLGQAAREAVFVAVSVDPVGDTPASIRGFLRRHRVEGVLIYLSGTVAQLQPIWAHYYVGSDAGEVNPAALAAPAPSHGPVDHTAIVYIIDPHGQIRAFLPGNFDPADLVTDIRALAARTSR